MDNYLKTFTQFIVNYEVKSGDVSTSEISKYSLKMSLRRMLYLRYVSKTDGRSISWHINKAIEMYIQQLSNDKK